MNRVIGFSVGLNHGSSGVPVVAPIPIKVPEGHAFRLRRVIFQLASLPNLDTDAFYALSQISIERAKESTARFRNTIWIAQRNFSIEVTTTGMASGNLILVEELWAEDYRLVMQPMFHTFAVGGLQTNTCHLYGEMVKATEGERNAIIAWQGGAK